MCPVIETAERSEDDAKSRSGVTGARPKAESPGTKPRDFAEDERREAGFCAASSISVLIVGTVLMDIIEHYTLIGTL